MAWTTRRAFVALACAAAVAAGAAVAAVPAPQVIRLTVKKFAYSPATVVVRKGVPVLLEITMLDRIHGFKLPDFDLRADVIPGRVTRLSFTPEEEGEFPYLCDIFCGEGHEDVSGTLVVRG